MRKLFILLLLSFIFFLSSCKTDFSAADTYEIQLTLKSAEVTEAWLKLSALPPDARATYTVKRDTHTVFEGKLDKADTLIHDTGLEPAVDYEYRAFINQQVVKSANLRITTMDTTSHNFTWQTFEFGGQNGSSYFNDVAIIDENDIWAVGEIHTADTDCWNEDSTEWLPAYNAAHWDGENWELIRIKTKAIGGVDYPAIKAIFSFASDNILFAHIDGSITHFNGNSFINDCSLVTELNGSANKIWGISKDDFYVVSGNGFISHYNGQGWTKIESGTDLDIYDIWGAKNERTGEYEILCVGSKHLQDPQYRRVIFNINGNRLKELSSYPIQWTLYSVWFIPGIKYYVAGAGIYKKNKLKDSNWYNGFWDITSYYTYRIRGTHINDVMAVGGFGEIVHFNGQSWKSYHGQTVVSGNYYSAAFKNNLAAACGYNGRAAVIAVGRRLN